MSDANGEAGDIVTGWLLRMLLWLGVLAFVVFEIGTLVVASVDVDSAAGEVARAATIAYRSNGSLAAARGTAEAVADERSVQLVTLDEDGATLVIEVSRQAGTLLLHRLPFTEDLAERTATRRVQIGA